MTIKTLKELAPGDPVTRFLSSDRIPMALKVTKVDDKLIHCGPWTFNKENGAEVDEDLGWDGVNVTGSFIRPE